MTDLTERITDRNTDIADMRKDVKKRRATAIYTVAASVTLVATISALLNYSINRNNIVWPAIESRKAFEKEYIMSSPYKSLFKRAYDNAKNHFLENGYVNKLDIKSKTVDDIATEYSVDPILLRNIMQINRVYAGIDHSTRPENNRVTFVNLLDPYLALLNPRMAEVMPENNLREGAKRLSGLLKKFNGDKEKALYAFYSPFAVEGCDNSSMEGLFDSVPGDQQTAAIKRDVANIVYTITHGFCWANDGGFHTVWMRNDAPSGYPFNDGTNAHPNMLYGSGILGGSDVKDFQKIPKKDSVKLNR